MANNNKHNNLPRGNGYTPNRSVARSIATIRPKLRDNTERIKDGSILGSAERQSYLNQQTRMPNTPLKIHTCTTVPEGASLHYDDIVETGVKYLIPDDFQNTMDRSDRVPPWYSRQASIDAPDAKTRTTKEAQLVEGYDKRPMRHVYSDTENRQISSGGVVDHTTKRPTFPADGNRY